MANLLGGKRRSPLGSHRTSGRWPKMNSLPSDETIAAARALVAAITADPEGYRHRLDELAAAIGRVRAAEGELVERQRQFNADVAITVRKRRLREADLVAREQAIADKVAQYRQ